MSRRYAARPKTLHDSTNTTPPRGFFPKGRSPVVSVEKCVFQHQPRSDETLVSRL